MKEKFNRKNNEDPEPAKEEFTSQNPGELHSEKMAEAQGDDNKQSETKPKSTSSKKTTSGNNKGSGSAKKSNTSSQNKKQTAATSKAK
ncbi:hypothetical protein [Virgibacillus litoralis]|uniref:Glycogen biosynthesis protein GlgD n=1 Tax=Virgibacillus litoralis TaxID=578221 RepID=A0ABS4HDY3_9BACI|nr:hypothetical protein [Virgibacillus litoralis]MBP1948824.1 hypothetical protein [Virgibacillus litoralis]